MARFDNVLATFLGFDRLLSEVERVLDNTASVTSGFGYPPYNVFKEPDGSYTIEVAVAGFTKDQISVKLDKRSSMLMISGSAVPQKAADVPSLDSAERPGDYIPPNPGRLTLRQGVAGRSFTRTFTIADTLVTDNINMADGLLVIKLKPTQRAEDDQVVQLQIQ